MTEIISSTRAGFSISATVRETPIELRFFLLIDLDEFGLDRDLKTFGYNLFNT